MKLYRLIAALMVSIPLFSIAQQDESYAKVVDPDKYEFGTWQVYPSFHVAISTTCDSKGDIWPSAPICKKQLRVLLQNENTDSGEDQMTDFSERLELSVAGITGTSEEVYELLRQQNKPIIRIGFPNIASVVELRDFTRVADTIYERALAEKSEEVASQRAQIIGYILLGLVMLSAGFFLIRKGIKIWPRLAADMATNRRKTKREFQSALKKLWMRKVVQEEIYRQVTRDVMAEAKNPDEIEALRKQISLARGGGNHDLATTLETALKRIEN